MGRKRPEDHVSRRGPIRLSILHSHPLSCPSFPSYLNLINSDGQWSQQVPGESPSPLTVRADESRMRKSVEPIRSSLLLSAISSLTESPAASAR